jgi:hypothetical protein
MGHQDEPALAVQVGAHGGPGLQVKVVGGLVDEQEAVFLQEQGGQQYFGPLPVGEGAEGTAKGILRHVEQ